MTDTQKSAITARQARGPVWHAHGLQTVSRRHALLSGQARSRGLSRGAGVRP
jgi:hypothetical protein